MMNWAGHIARIGAKRNVYGILIGKPEGNRRIGRPRRRCVDNIKLDLREIQWGGMDWIYFAWDRKHLSALVNSVMKTQIP
jgi:hypothetical protein